MKNVDEFKENINCSIRKEEGKIMDTILKINDIVKRYPGVLALDGVSMEFKEGEVHSIMGENGAGKSTLIKIISGAIKPDEGTIEIGDTVSIGVFAQENRELDLKMRAIDYIREGGESIPTEKGERITASTLAERFMFDGNLQYSLIEKLSGGEKRRLQLLRILMESPNVLILDEPTNDLDIETLKILEDFLDEFLGVVIVVSHDRYFLDRICNKIFAYEGDGKIKTYVGNYSDYLIQKEEEYSENILHKVKEETKVKECKKV